MIFFPLKYWLNLCLGALWVLYSGQRFFCLPSPPLCTDLCIGSSNPNSCLSDVEVIKSSVAVGPLSSNWCYIFFHYKYSTEKKNTQLNPAVLQTF